MNDDEINEQEQAEIAKRYGISVEQLEESKRQAAAYNERRKNPGLYIPKAQITQTYPPDFPQHILEAIDATEAQYKDFCGAWSTGEFYKAAVKCASNVKLAWSKNGLSLPGIPLAKNLDWPTKEEILRLNLWFREALSLVQAETAMSADAPEPNNDTEATAEIIKAPQDGKQEKSALDETGNYELPWQENRPGFITATEAQGLIEEITGVDRSLPWVSAKVKDHKNEIRFMHSNKQRLWPHREDFIKYLNSSDLAKKRLVREATAKAEENLLRRLTKSLPGDTEI